MGKSLFNNNTMKKGDKVRITAKEFVSNGGIFEIEGIGENGIIYLLELDDLLFFYEDELELVTKK
jgi:hypothetical protein